MAMASKPCDERVADLVQAGQIRAAMFLPQYVNDSMTGELRGNESGIVFVQLIRTLAAQLGIEVKLVGYPTPPDVMKALTARLCDLGFMGINGSRAGAVDFTPALLSVDFTYLVSEESTIRRIADADRAGVHIAAIRNHESTLTLERLLKHATLIEAATPNEAFDRLRKGSADALASARTGLLDFSTRLPGSRVLEDHYGLNHLAVAVPKGKAGRLAYMSEFTEAAKGSGLVGQLLDQSGLRGVHLAPRTIQD